MVGIIIKLRASLKRMCNNRAGEKRTWNRTFKEQGELICPDEAANQKLGWEITVWQKIKH